MDKFRKKSHLEWNPGAPVFNALAKNGGNVMNLGTGKVGYKPSHRNLQAVPGKPLGSRDKPILYWNVEKII